MRVFIIGVQERRIAHLLLSLLLPLDVGVNALSDGELAGSLADLSQVGTGESLRHLGQEGKVHFLGYWTLPEVGLEDGHPGALVRQRDVDQLVKTSGSKERNERGNNVGRSLI